MQLYWKKSQCQILPFVNTFFTRNCANNCYIIKNMDDRYGSCYNGNVADS